MRKTLIAVCFLSLVGACSSTSVEPFEASLAVRPGIASLDGGTLESNELPAPKEESQGRTLVGSSLGEPEPIFKTYVPANVGTLAGSGTLVRWNGKQYVSVGAGEYFQGMVQGGAYPNGASYWLVITRTDSPQSSSDPYVQNMDPVHKTTTLYTVYFADRHGNPVQPFCQADYNGSIQSIIQPGYFDDKGALHLEEKNVFTFGCLSGVIGKCGKWKYLPWEQSDLHWACTRAARADYCGTGETHTLNDTPVDVYDNASPSFNVEDAGTPSDGRAHVDYESAWTTSGSFCVTGPRWPQLIDAQGKQLCGKSSPIMDASGNPYLCKSFEWAIKVAGDRQLPGPFIAIDSNHGPLPPQ